MTTKRITRPLLSISAWIVIQLILSLPANAQPQTFEFSYGSSTCVERGFKGAEPVDIQGGCLDGGFVAVGTSSEPLLENGCANCYNVPGACDDNVYVVRTNPNGTRIAEFVYDVTGNGLYDNAVVIRELSNGFIIAGTTQAIGGTSDVFLLRIACNGSVMFARTYGIPGVNDFASDLIVATTGNGATTRPGDFIISGWSERGGTTMTDGLLIRTTSAGTMIWNGTYNVPGSDPDQHDDYFHTLIEDQTAGAGTGDIIAAGHTTSFSFFGPNFLGEQGLAVRVSGNTGNIGFPPQGAAYYGGANQDERFDAIEELTSNYEWGNLVFAGSTSGLGVEDIYLVKTTNNPCQMLAQNTVNHVTGSAEVALGIVESWTPGMPFCPIGELAVVGRTRIDCSNPDPTGPYTHDEALLLHVIPATLTAVTGKHFGSQMGCVRSEVFYSVMDVGQSDPGFIMCGSTADNPGLITPWPTPDPSNLYLVKTDGNGETGCEEEWNFTQQNPGWEAFCINAVRANPLTSQVANAIFRQKFHSEDVCPSNAPNGISPGQGAGIGGLDDEFDILESGSLSLPLSGKSETSAGDGTGKSATIRAKVRMKEE